MPVRVVDASAVAALLFDDPAAGSVCEQFGADSLAAPSLLPYEIGNVCIKKQRRNGLRVDLVEQAFRSLANLHITLYDVEALQVLAIANASGLSFYDASYLWLADKLSAPLVTLDKRLQSVH